MSEVTTASAASPKRILVPGQGSLLLRGRTWWVCYYVAGKERRESARQPKEGFMRGDKKDASERDRDDMLRHSAFQIEPGE